MKTLQLCGLLLLTGLFVMNLSLVAQEVEESLKYGRLNSDQVLWSGAGINFKKVRHAEAGLLVQIIGEKGTYYRVLVPDGFICYVHVDYLKVAENNRGEVTGNSVFLRSIPSKEGDYPLRSVEKGLEVLVWGRVGEWYRITAPEIAHVYVPKAEVTLVEVTDALLQEVETLRASRETAWMENQKEIQAEMQRKMKAEGIYERFLALERAAGSSFAGMELEQVLEDYKQISKEAESEIARKVASARINEVSALIDRNKAVKEFEDRQTAWQKEREILEKELRKARDNKVKSTPSSHKEPGKGRLVSAVGIVDAVGPGVVLRGGRSEVDVMYRISCPDGRYILGDFQNRRIKVKGRLSEDHKGEDSPLIIVERIELR